MSLAALTRPACRTCQHSVLQSFTAIAGISLVPAPQWTSIQPQAVRQQQRFYTQSPNKPQELSSWAQSQKPESGGDNEEPLMNAVEADNPSTPTPWYLRVPSPSPPPTAALDSSYQPSLAQRQTLPPLPASPPAILPHILQYLSIESGLDNLSLIDLRHLDPPPALGANLIMLLGTARSVKHLNVSADRFCRWLRSKYKIRPYADGLLGRNELKLKLRRKARRLKLAQSVGNTIEQGKDDGITTGWICVNVGSVEGVLGDEEAAEKEGEKEGDVVADTDTPPAKILREEAGTEVDNGISGYIGFGSRSTAPRIVVQMFIEEKRAELDLEGLWDTRTARRAAKEDRAVRKEPPESDRARRQREQLEFESHADAARQAVYGRL